MDSHLGGKRNLVAGGSKEKLLTSHIVFTVVCSVATCKVRMVTSSRVVASDLTGGLRSPLRR
jgi:hypothetical protein